MPRGKTVHSLALIASLTTAAFVLATGLDAIIGKSLEVAAVKRPAAVEQDGGNNALRAPGERSLLSPPVPENSAAAARRNGPGKHREIEAECGAGIRKVFGNRWFVKRTSLPADPARLNRVLMQARIVPAVRGGRTFGFRISRISPGSFFEKVGLQNGDVITRVNLQRLTTLDRALRLFRKLSSERTIFVELRRSGKTRTLIYDIR
jgi:general secretion pathway protein C